MNPLNKNYFYFLFFIAVSILIFILALTCFNEFSELNKELLANKLLIQSLQKEVELLKAVKIVVSPPEVSSPSLTLRHYVALGAVASVLIFGIYLLSSAHGSGNTSNSSSIVDKFDSSSLFVPDLDQALKLVLDTKPLVNTAQNLAQNSNSDAFKGNFNTLRGCEPPEFISTELSKSSYIPETVSLFFTDISKIVYGWVEFFILW